VTITLSVLCICSLFYQFSLVSILSHIFTGLYFYLMLENFCQHLFNMLQLLICHSLRLGSVHQTLTLHEGTQSVTDLQTFILFEFLYHCVSNQGHNGYRSLDL
jgi:hypothetical protein